MACNAEVSRGDYLNVEELALFTGISASTWNKRRLSGDTPPFCKIGRSVRYKRTDVEIWLNGRSVTSTSATPLDGKSETAAA